MYKLEQLENEEAEQLDFINGQFENGNYDMQDMYGSNGHLEALDKTRGDIQDLREDMCLTPKEWEEVRNWYDPAITFMKNL